MEQIRMINVTKNPEETQALGEALVKRLPRVFALHGELGSGKTTFVQGLARGLGVKRRIISPTFIIIRQYKISPHLGGGEATTSTPARCNTFYHVDLYRVENERDVEGLGLEEIMKDKNNIVAIEWAEKMGTVLPKKRWDVYFEHLSDDKRKITISVNHGGTN